MKILAMLGILSVTLILTLSLPTAICSNVSTPHSEVSQHQPMVLPKVLTKLLTSTENVPIYMEGQHSSPSNQTSVSLKDKVTPDAAVETVTSSVHARKGVDPLPEDKHIINSTIPEVSINKTKEVIPVNKIVDLKTANDTKVNTTTNTTVEVVPKKPKVTIARYDENLIKKENVTPSSTTKTESKMPESSEKKEKVEDHVPVQDYIKYPNPDIDDSNKNSNFFTYIRNVPSNQPGFIVPVIITLLAVPFLALIGYQAVRRGREAWRNRHYRRMDYLIDGLYND